MEVGKDGKFHCPQCEQVFDTGVQLRGHLSGHARRSKSQKAKADAARAAKKVAPVKAKLYRQNLGGPVECPECKRICVNRATLANHRRAAHKVPSANEIYRLERAAQREAAKLGLLPPSPSTPQPTQERQIVYEQSNGNAAAHPDEPQPSTRPDPFAYAILVGETLERCRHTAAQHDIPERVFAREFGELFYRQTRG